MLNEEKQMNWFQKRISRIYFYFQRQNRDLPQASSYLIIIGLVLTILSFFSLKTLLSLSILFFGIYLKFRCSLEQILNKGLMNYLPQATQTILTTRSIFDILCDFWYIVRIPSYIKVFFRPFFLEIEPEQAITNLNELHPSIKQVILRKGIINNFPENLKKLILPSQKQIAIPQIVQESDDTNAEEEKLSIHSNEIQFFHQQQSPKELQQIDLTSGRDLLSRIQRGTNESYDSDEELRELQIKRGQSCGNLYQVFGKKSGRLSISEQQSEMTDNEEQNASTVLGGSAMKTRVITSSQSMNFNQQLLQKYFCSKNGINESAQFSQKWDKLELFQKEKKFQKERVSENKLRIKGPIAFIYQLLQIKKMGLSNAIGSKDLRLIFALSSLGFLWQLYISKRVRGWTANTFVVIFYIIFFVLSTSSWFLLVYKMVKSRSITQSDIEMIKEEIKEDDEEDYQEEEIQKLNNEEDGAEIKLNQV